MGTSPPTPGKPPVVLTAPELVLRQESCSSFRLSAVGGVGTFRPSFDCIPDLLLAGPAVWAFEAVGSPSPTDSASKGVDPSPQIYFEVVLM